MSKKFMHIMIDDSVNSEDVSMIYNSLRNLEDIYDIAITSSKVQISTFNDNLVHEINDKLDIIIENMDKFNTIRSDIKNDIKYVFGLTNNLRRR